MESKELFKALTGDAERLKDRTNSAIDVKDVDVVESDKTIAVIKTLDDKLLVSSSRNVVQVVPLLREMTKAGSVKLFVTATDIGNGKSTISVKLEE